MSGASDRSPADFLGRAWVCDELDRLLEQPGDRVVLVTGPPGAGKTALAQRIAETRAVIHAHFCRARDAATLDPLLWLKAVVVRLAERVPAYADALLADKESGMSVVGRASAETVTSSTVAGVVIEQLYLGNLTPRAALARRVVAPLEAAGPGEPLTLLVDGLDETLDSAEDDSFVELLAVAAGSLARLERPIRLLAMSRGDERVLEALPHVRLDLVDDAPEGEDDVAAFVDARLGGHTRLGARVAKAARGSFLYARLVTDELLLDPTGDAPLPDTLGDFYDSYLTRGVARDRRWSSVYRPLLGMLSVARGAGLPVRTLAGALGLPLSATRDALAPLSQYLEGPRPDGPFRIYHESFREFLVGDRRHPVFPEEASDVLASFLLEQYDGRWLELACDSDPAGRYALEHAPAHLLEAVAAASGPVDRGRRLERVRALLSDLAFTEAKTAIVGIDAVLDDLERLRGEGAGLPGLHGVLDRVAYVLRGWDRDELPALFAQLVHLRAGALGDAELAASAARRLEHSGAAWWRFGWARGPAMEGLVRTIAVHGTRPTALAITPDGRACAAGGEDGSVRAWDVATGRERWALRVHTDEVFALAAGHEWFVSCSADGSAARIAVEDGECHALGGGGRWITGVTTTSDGEWAFGSADSGILRWELATGEPTALASPWFGRPRLFATGDGTTLLGQWADNINLLDFSARRSASLEPWNSERRLSAAAPMPDGRSLLCFYEPLSHGASVAPEVRDVASGAVLNTLEGPDFAWGVTVDATGTWAASVTDRGIVVWDLEQARAVGLLHSVSPYETTLAAGPDRLLATGERDQTIRLWNVDRAAPLDAPVPEQPVRQRSWPLAATSHNDRHTVSATWDTPTFGLFTWSELTAIDDHRPARIELDGTVLEDPHGPLTALAVNDRGDRVLAASWDATVAVWDAQRATLARRLATGAAAAGITVALSGRRPGVIADTLVAGQAAATALAVTGDDRAFVATRNGSLQEWDLASGELRAAAALDAPAVALELGPDEATLVVADNRGRILCLDFCRGGETARISGCS